MKLPTSISVQGITSLNDELYVVTNKSPDIDVYDIDTLVHRRKIRVKGLGDGWDIVAQCSCECSLIFMSVNVKIN